MSENPTDPEPKDQDELSMLLQDLVRSVEVTGEMPNLKASDPDVEIVKKLIVLNPSQKAVTECLMKNPPTVNYEGKKLATSLTAIEPTEEELEWADKKIDLSALPLEKDFLDLAHISVEMIQKFLRARRLKDEFDDHNHQRRPWEIGILTALAYVDRERKFETTTHVFSPKDQERYDSGSYAVGFKREYDLNKYSRALIKNMFDSLISISYYLSLDNEDAAKVGQKFGEFVGELDQLGFSEKREKGVKYDQLEKSQKEGGLDKKIDDISEVAIRVLGFIEKPNSE